MMAQPVPDTFSLENPVFTAYLFYSCILVLKMMLMSFLESRLRFKNKAFANPEDGKWLKVKPRVDENVERVRRAHLNDLENIPLFFVSAFIYTMTNPSEYVAKSLFLTYTVARITHTLVYAVIVIPQPARALSFSVGYFITGFLAVKGMLHFM